MSTEAEKKGSSDEEEQSKKSTSSNSNEPASTDQNSSTTDQTSNSTSQSSAPSDQPQTSSAPTSDSTDQTPSGQSPRDATDNMTISRPTARVSLSTVGDDQQIPPDNGKIDTSTTNQTGVGFPSQPEVSTIPEIPGKNPAAVSLGRLGGLKGGKARANSLTKRERSEAARKAARARWRKKEQAK
jgi:hypothetical protein